mgnify:CR=1 FL=1
MTDGLVWDAGTPEERGASPAEARALLAEIEEAFTSACAHLIYRHQARHGGAAAEAEGAWEGFQRSVS